MNNVHFAIPEIYGETLSYYELLRKLVNKTNELIENYNTVPEQIAEAVANLDASQLFSAVLNQLINSIATDNTKSANAVKVYKKHDLLYATFNETVNLYESLIDFTAGTETELIVGSNIREVNISELFIELRKLIDDEAQTRIQSDTTLQTNIDNEARARTQADTTLQTNIDNEARARTQADGTKVNKSDVLTFEEIQASTDLSGKIASASAILLNNYMAKLSGNFPSNSTTEYTIYNYPDGYNQDNCHVIMAEFYIYGNWYDSNALSKEGVVIILQRDGVRVQHPSLTSKLYGIPYRIILIKY